MVIIVLVLLAIPIETSSPLLSVPYQSSVNSACHGSALLKYKYLTPIYKINAIFVTGGTEYKSQLFKLCMSPN